MIRLSDINKKNKYIIKDIDDNLTIKNRLIELGFNKDTIIEYKYNNLLNSLNTFKYKNTLIALRTKDLKYIYVDNYES